MTELTSVTAAAVREAVALYFEPLRGIRRWFNGPDDCDRGAVVHHSEHSLLVEELHAEHADAKNLRYLAFEEILHYLDSQVVFVTCAGHPAASRIAIQLAERARQVCLVDNERRRPEVVKRWGGVVSPDAKIRLKYMFGNLADENWLCGALESERPTVIFDFTTHAYLRARVPSRLDRRNRAAKSYEYVYEKAEVITNIMRCSAAMTTVKSLFLVMPRFAENDALDQFNRLYSIVLRDYAVALGAHTAPEEPTISLWAPKQRAFSFSPQVRTLRALKPADEDPLVVCYISSLTSGATCVLIAHARCTPHPALPE